MPTIFVLGTSVKFQAAMKAKADARAQFVRERQSTVKSGEYPDNPQT
jgi:hypothetical protein